MKNDDIPEYLQQASMRKIAQEDADFTDIDTGPETDMMEQVAQEDAGFINIDRKPEADSVNPNQGFLSN
jgi:hypothetical protein